MPATDKSRTVSVSNDKDENEDDAIDKHSPCGRWEKRKKQYPLRDYPCYPSAFIAIDTEEGLEVVWIEVRINPKSQHQFETIRTLLDIVLRYEHPNLVKFLDYWIEDEENGKLIVLISELLTCGSLSQFIRKSKLNGRNISMNIWVRWCKQILLGMSYLHTREPPFILRSLSCDSIFIQHNGLIKIALIHSLGGVESDSYDCTFGLSNKCTCYINTKFIEDIISFGHVALSLATHDCSSSVSSFFKSLNPERCSSSNLSNRIQEISSRNYDQADFILQSIEGRKNGYYPSIRSLFLHPVLFEVPSLRLLSLRLMVENDMHKVIENEEYPKYNTGEVVAKAYKESKKDEVGDFKDTDFSPMELQSTFEEVKIGKHPITCTKGYDVHEKQKKYLTLNKNHDHVSSSPYKPNFKRIKPKCAGSIKGGTCFVYQRKSDSRAKNNYYVVSLKLEMKNNCTYKLNRNFNMKTNSSYSLAGELIDDNFVKTTDFPFLQQLIGVAMKVNKPVICSKE